jgi:PAS domain S-box-containing protein
MEFKIGKDTFDLSATFPFAFTLNRDLLVENVQPSLSKLNPDLNNQPFSSYFIIKRPWSAKPEFESIKGYINQLFLVQLNNCSLVLRGQFLLLPTEEMLLFLGTPWVTKEEDLLQNKLLLTDFSLSDPTPDLLQMMKANEINMKDIYVLMDRLDAQKEFYEGILNSIPSDIAAFSPEHEYLFVNPMGIANPEIRKWIIGKTDYDYCEYRNKPISIADNRREKFGRVKLTGKQLQWEEKMEDAKGVTSYYVRTLFPVMNQDKSLKMVLGYGMNITERKRIEDELKKSEELYRLIIEATNDGIWDWDIKSDHVFFNKRLIQMFGYEEHEFESHVSMWGKIMHQEDFQVAQEILKSHFENDTPFLYKLRFFHKEGYIKWIMCRGFALRDENGKPYRMLGSYIDVTDAKITEETLMKAKEAAEEAGRSKETFLANMSHEIRTPLNGIIGMANLLNKTELTGSQSEYLHAIKYSADNLLVIINDVLDLAKIEAGKLTLESIDFDLTEIAQNALKSLTYKAEDKGIQLIGNFPEDCFLVKGDPYRLTQILTNLLNNAIKFTTNGKVELSVNAKKMQDKIEVLIWVKDTGIGIHRYKIDSIFDSFTQAQSDTTRKFGGTGLGLAICKNLVEMQGGTIDVASEFGKGSVFTFNIAYKVGKLESKSKLPENKSVEFKKIKHVKILLAEDNEINQFLACELLKSWGMEVDTAKNGLEAIEKWAKNEYDLILMDIQMPELGGVEATIEIRNRQLSKSNVPIIALTANALKGQKERFMSFGMNDYLSKPFNETELYNKIVSLLPEGTKNVISVTKTTKGLYDFSKLQQISNGNKDFEKKLMGVFVDTVPESLGKLRLACESGNMENLSATAHKLKTTINAMGIEQLKGPIQNLEDSANAKKEIKLVSQLSNQIIDTLEDIVNEFKEKLS